MFAPSFACSRKEIPVAMNMVTTGHGRLDNGLQRVQEQWVSEFAAQWDDYDWTKQLV